MTKRPYVIEFIGLPGAGKTTLCQALLKDVRSKQNEITLIQDASRHRIAWLHESRIKRFSSLVFYTLGRAKSLFMQCVLVALKMRPLHLTGFRLMLAYPHFDMITAKIAARLSAPIVLYDQGCLQYLWSVHLRSVLPDENECHALWDLTISKPDMVVELRCSADVSHARVRERPSNDSRFDRMDDDTFFRIMNDSAVKLQEIVKCYTDYTDVPVIELDCTDAPERNADIILEALQELEVVNEG